MNEFKELSWIFITAILSFALLFDMIFCSLNFEVYRDVRIKVLPLVSSDISQIPNLWKETPWNWSEIYLIENSMENKHSTSCSNSFC